MQGATRVVAKFRCQSEKKDVVLSGMPGGAGGFVSLALCVCCVCSLQFGFRFSARLFPAS